MVCVVGFCFCFCFGGFVVGLSVGRREVLFALVEALRVVPDDWGVGRVVWSAGVIVRGGVVDLRGVSDVELLRGLGALLPDPFEDVVGVVWDPFAREWERARLL